MLFWNTRKARWIIIVATRNNHNILQKTICQENSVFMHEHSYLLRQRLRCCDTTPPLLKGGPPRRTCRSKFTPTHNTLHNQARLMAHVRRRRQKVANFPCPLTLKYTGNSRSYGIRLLQFWPFFTPRPSCRRFAQVNFTFIRYEARVRPTFVARVRHNTSNLTAVIQIGQWNWQVLSRSQVLIGFWRFSVSRRPIAALILVNTLKGLFKEQGGVPSLIRNFCLHKSIVKKIVKFVCSEYCLVFWRYYILAIWR